MISKRLIHSMAKEIEKIGFSTNAYSGAMNPNIRLDNSYIGASKLPIPKIDHGGVGISGRGSEPTRGGFLLASKQASTLERQELVGGDVPEDVERENIERQKEKHVFNGDHMQHLIDQARGDGVDRGKIAAPISQRLERLYAHRPDLKKKESDGLAEGIPYSSSDFMRAKLAKALAKLAFSPNEQLASSSNKFKTPNVEGNEALSIQQTSKPFGWAQSGKVPATDKGGQI